MFIQHKSLGSVALGRIKPLAAFDFGRFRIVVAPNGEQYRVPRFSCHYDRSLDQVSPSTTVDWSPKAVAALSQMYLNDTRGDCVIAGSAHAIGVWSGNETGTPIIATDAEILHNYTSICGPGDNGCMITGVLHALHMGRFIMNGAHRSIHNYVAIDWTNQNEVQVALEVFGSMIIGVNLTNDCENSGPGVVWNFTGNIVGGHCVTVYGCNADGLLISTWGSIGTVIPWTVALKNAGSGPGIDEAYVALSPNWDSANNIAPNGINGATLVADLKLVAENQIPPLPTE